MNKNVHDFISRTRLFSHADKLELADITSRFVKKSFTKDALIFSSEIPMPGFYIQRTGRTKIFVLRGLNDDPREVILNFMKPGDCFGEIALLDRNPRSADARAYEDSEILFMSPRDFHNLKAGNAAFRDALFFILCDRIRFTTQLYEDYATLPTVNRLARKLAILADKFATADLSDSIKIDLRLTQDVLGQMLGISRKSVNKHLTSLRNEGIIKDSDANMGGAKRIIIRDHESLKQKALLSDTE